jgi:hypothetical protein
MASQKLPLFGGMIQPIHVGMGLPAVQNDIFTPPDKTSKAPQTYELHLWVMASAAGQTLAVVSQESATGKVGLAWGGISAGGNVGVPQKVLDGYPVRGDVKMALLASSAAADPYPVGPQMWGYYLPVGQGALREDERRFIGAALQKSNAGVGFVLSSVQPSPASFPAGSPDNAIVHTFEPNRIDELSLAFTPYADIGALARLTFEDAANQPIIPLHYVQFVAYTSYGPGAPAFGAFPPSPYLLHKIPFGGGGIPKLHHIRVKIVAFEGDTGLGVHGYFIRK